MDNTNTQNIASLADAFRTDRSTAWGRVHNAGLEDLVFRNRFGLLRHDQKHTFYTLSLLQDIASNATCDRAVWLNISYWILRLEDLLTGDYYGEEVIQDCKQALYAWHEHSPVRGSVTEECLSARSDLADYALQLLNYEMGRIDCGTVDGIVRASVGQ